MDIRVLKTYSEYSPNHPTTEGGLLDPWPFLHKYKIPFFGKVVSVVFIVFLLISRSLLALISRLKGNEIMTICVILLLCLNRKNIVLSYVLFKNLGSLPMKFLVARLNPGLFYWTIMFPT